MIHSRVTPSKHIGKAASCISGQQGLDDALGKKINLYSWLMDTVSGSKLRKHRYLLLGGGGIPQPSSQFKSTILARIKVIVETNHIHKCTSLISVKQIFARENSAPVGGESDQ